MAEASQSESGTAISDVPITANGGGTTQLAQLDDLNAQATLKYSVKDYDAAAELYSEATELQAELNGEMSPLNAELLYKYGRCLYHVAVKNSDVLGLKVTGGKREDGLNRKSAKAAVKQANGNSNGVSRANEGVPTKVAETRDGSVKAAKDANSDSKPYFQFTGDENFDDSEDEDGDDEQDEEEQEAEEDGGEDDFANAYEVLDLARVLLLKRIEEEHAAEGKGKASGDTPAIKYIKGLLADSHDLQAEISLEGERYPNAVADIKESLALKEGLLPFEHSHIAEAHFKLSLALEFSSVTQQKTVNGELADGGQAQVDEAMREEAAKEMELAIASCKSRIEKEQASLDAGSAPPDTGAKGQVTQEQIDDVKDMVKDMEQRVIELRQPPASINDPASTGAREGLTPLSGILGSIPSESPAAQKARLEKASKDVNDLTNLVKRKRVSNASSPQPASDGPSQTNGKRKVEFNEETIEVRTGKKAKLEDRQEQ